MIIKEVKPFGNGAQILVSKNWIGKKVILSLKDRSLDDIKKELLNDLNDLTKVACIVLIGSYARNEQLYDSDVDIMVFCRERLNIKLNNFHIILINTGRLREEIALNPALFKSILDEGIAVLNSDFLKNVKIIDKDVSNYKKECYNAYLSNKEFIKLDKEQSTLSLSVIYSIILRLRALFILKNKYSFNKFREWIIRNNLNFDELYNIYKSIRNDKETKNIDYKLINEVEKANEFLFKQIK